MIRELAPDNHLLLRARQTPRNLESDFESQANFVLPSQPRDWDDLINFVPTQEVQKFILNRSSQWAFQTVDQGEGDINLDFYPIHIRKLPFTSEGRRMTPESLLERVRLNFNNLLNRGLATFHPYKENIDGPRWASFNPLGAVISIDMEGPDNGSVACTHFTKRSWIFTTLFTEKDGRHPVSGNRQWGIMEHPLGTGHPDGGYIFYTRGADRATSSLDQFGTVVLGFQIADSLWTSLQKGLQGFINYNNGHAVSLNRISQRFPWDENNYSAPRGAWIKQLNEADEGFLNEDGELDNETVDEGEFDHEDFIPYESEGVLDKWAELPDQKTFLERVLSRAIAISSQRRAPLRDLLSGELAPVGNTRIEMKRDAAIAAGNLIAEANRKLEADRLKGIADALKTTKITAISGYRGRAHQEEIWRNNFKRKYYNRTASTRAELSGGPHGDDAVKFMTKDIRWRVASPGFSNHQAGLAIDLKQNRTKGNRIRNSTSKKSTNAWKETWFFDWLEENAKRYGFIPYSKEPWHWTFKQGLVSRVPASPSPVVPRQDFSGTLLGSLGAVAKPFFNLIKSANEFSAIALAFNNGVQDETTLTDLVFKARHPELGGRKLARHEGGLIQEWLMIREKLVRRVLGELKRTRVNGKNKLASPITNHTLTFNRVEVPDGFRRVKRGLSRYGGGRLDEALIRLRSQGRLEITNDEIDLFQRVANIESMGELGAINTWDSAVVSLGFMQWTLQHGKLQRWIQLAEEPFRKFGIEVDLSKNYKWGKDLHPAIKGVPRKEDLRWGFEGWPQRFYHAGLDDDIVIAEVKLAREKLSDHLRRLKRRLNNDRVYNNFIRHYNSSPEVRGIFQASFNNLPSRATRGVLSAINVTSSDAETFQFLEIYKDSVRRAFSQEIRGKGFKGRGVNLTTKTLHGARFSKPI
jgi:D-alanyl-D-alanine carboxypeptidase